MEVFPTALPNSCCAYMDSAYTPGCISPLVCTYTESAYIPDCIIPTHAVHAWSLHASLTALSPLVYAYGGSAYTPDCTVLTHAVHAWSLCTSLTACRSWLSQCVSLRTENKYFWCSFPNLCPRNVILKQRSLLS